MRLSVVIPAYNEGAFLDATLASLAVQRVAGGVEVIVVDNASTDDTAVVAARYGARVLHEPQRGVCAARQRGTLAARGEIVVSTDADTRFPPGWLARVEARFTDGVVAVAGPCRYADPPWWARIFPPLYFAAIDARYRATGRIGYITATNVAFRREDFPGYDTSLTQGGDEVDFLRRLRRRGHVAWDGGNPVLTSSRRMDQGLAYTVLVSYGYHYALNLAVNRVTGRRVLGAAPAIREQDVRVTRRRRRRWRVGLLTAVGALVLVRRQVTERRGTRAVSARALG
ncbi:glycosyltransferase family 2 protein [uncultured Friedmanniella sp.]|uniref:glycosyltransferase family 2 protein n=1 Tax=uncultured Friedmanniella sp. TaxID=335381 RepID=UPI0035CB1FFA